MLVVRGGYVVFLVVNWVMVFWVMMVVNVTVIFLLGVRKFVL